MFTLRHITDLIEPVEVSIYPSFLSCHRLQWLLQIKHSRNSIRLEATKTKKSRDRRFNKTVGCEMVRTEDTGLHRAPVSSRNAGNPRLPQSCLFWQSMKAFAATGKISTSATKSTAKTRHNELNIK